MVAQMCQWLIPNQKEYPLTEGSKHQRLARISSHHYSHHIFLHLCRIGDLGWICSVWLLMQRRKSSCPSRILMTTNRKLILLCRRQPTEDILKLQATNMLLGQPCRLCPRLRSVELLWRALSHIIH